MVVQSYSKHLQFLRLTEFLLGTIHLRRRQIFTNFRPLPPYRWQIWQIFDPSPLENTDVLNGWSQRSNVAK